MAWQIKFTNTAQKHLSKIDRQIQKRIKKVLQERIAKNHPRDFGEPLQGSLSGLWKYRVGDYRIIAEIQDEVIVILVLRIGHRSKIYNTH